MMNLVIGILQIILAVGFILFWTYFFLVENKKSELSEMKSVVANINKMNAFIKNQLRARGFEPALTLVGTIEAGAHLYDNVCSCSDTWCEGDATCE